MGKDEDKAATSVNKQEETTFSSKRRQDTTPTIPKSADVQLKPPQKPTSTSKRKSKMGYDNQVVRAGIWGGLYFFIWIIQRLWCHLGLPEHCTLSEEPLDVLTDLLVLFTFALTQAWWCELLEEGRWEQLKKAPWVFVIIFFMPLFISAMGLISGMEPWDQSNPGEDFRFSSSRSTIYVFGLVFVVLFIAWHFARAWLTLPGVYLISGGAEDAKPPGKNLHGIYMVSRVVIVVYCILFTSFLLAEDNGMDYRGALLAWTLSLLACFPHNVSNLWLALNTGIFLHGISSHRLAFLGCK